LLPFTDSNQKAEAAEVMTRIASDDNFAQVVRLAPLVSIDLIIRDPIQDVLVARRTTAKGFYFVPGGRICKGETIEAAFVRILKVETGIEIGFDRAQFLGVFQHFYSTTTTLFLPTSCGWITAPPSPSTSNTTSSGG
jgi:colanic acid biosynthesis protein WcaH